MCDVFGLVENGIFDVGIATDIIKIRSNVSIGPICSEPLLCIAGSGAEYADGITPDQLDLYREVRYITVPTFNSWYDYWFPTGNPPYIFSDKLSIDGGDFRLNRITGLLHRIVLLKLFTKDITLK